jgi:hypothetical protein
VRVRAFTLLEITIYVTILVSLGVPLTSVVLSSIRSTTDNDVIQRIEERNRSALGSIERELRRCMSGTVSITDSGRTISITPAIGYSASAVVPGNRLSFAFTPVATETVNGADDNGNGLVDEGQLVRTDVATGEQVVINSSLRVSACGFSRTGLGVTVTVTSVGRLVMGDTYSVTKSETLYPRN